MFLTIPQHHIDVTYYYYIHTYTIDTFSTKALCIEGLVYKETRDHEPAPGICLSPMQVTPPPTTSAQASTTLEPFPSSDLFARYATQSGLPQPEVNFINTKHRHLKCQVMAFNF